MTTITTTFHRQLERISPTRRITTGVVFILFGLITWLAFARVVQPNTIANFGLTPSGAGHEVPPLLINAPILLYVSALLSVLLGIYQAVRGFRRWTNWVLSLVIGMFIFSFLVWATAGKSLNLGGLIATTLNKAVPLTLGAMAGILCERSGVVNIAIEGMMLAAAMVAALVGSLTHSLWLGLVCAMLTGFVLALLLAVLSIKYKTNQIIVGTVINILSTGLTSYISAKFLQVYQQLNNPGIFARVRIPLLYEIPLIGPILFDNTIFVYAMFILLVVLQVALFKTRWGLRVRAVGEHPKAADTLGINVFRTRYMSVLLGGLMAGFAGAYFTLGSVGRFDEVMTAGRGFIALAAMLFGNWTPFGSLGAGLLFGFADSLAARLAILKLAIPSSFLLMAPYIATMVILAGVIGRSQMPAADGVPYEKE